MLVYSLSFAGLRKQVQTDEGHGSEVSTGYWQCGVWSIHNYNYIGVIYCNHVQFMCVGFVAPPITVGMRSMAVTL